jgi:hypothetical protein
VSSCTSSNAFYIVEIIIQCTGLPWTVRYLGFGGTLPNITFFDVEHLLQSIRAMDALGGSIIDCYYYDGSGTATMAIDSNGTTMTMAGSLAFEPAPRVRLI